MARSFRFHLTWEGAALIVISALLFIFPVIRLVFLSLSAEDGGWTLAHYRTLFTDSRAGEAVWNTIYISLSASIISAVCGVTTAFLVGYTNIRYKKLIEVLVYLPFVIPAYVITLSWTGLTRCGRTALPSTGSLAS